MLSRARNSSARLRMPFAARLAASCISAISSAGIASAKGIVGVFIASFCQKKRIGQVSATQSVERGIPTQSVGTRR